MDPLFEDDDFEDDDFDINPFWSSDEEEEEKKDEKKKESDDKENIERKKDLTSNDFKIKNRDSGIVLSETKDSLEGVNNKTNNKTDNEKLSQDVESINLNGTNNEHKLTRNFSEGTCKVENKLYTIKDKSGKTVIEDDLSREYSRQKSSENNGKETLKYQRGRPYNLYHFLLKRNRLSFVFIS